MQINTHTQISIKHSDFNILYVFSLFVPQKLNFERSRFFFFNEFDWWFCFIFIFIINVHIEFLDPLPTDYWWWWVSCEKSKSKIEFVFTTIIFHVNFSLVLKIDKIWKIKIMNEFFFHLKIFIMVVRPCVCCCIRKTWYLTVIIKRTHS